MKCRLVALGTTLGTLAVIAGLAVSLHAARAADREAAGTAGESDADLDRLTAQYRRPTAIPFPEDNPPSPDREILGKTLFFDPRLSRSGIMACATCHHPAFSWSDGLPRAIGHGMQRLGRRTPTLLNLAWAGLLFWDGRARTLEEQALGPIEAPAEMNMPVTEVVAVLGRIEGYRALFEHAYPGEGITPRTIGKALATFERTIVSGVAPFDRWIGGDRTAISPSARRGFVLFNTRARCARCHSGWNFTDGSFHDIGLASEDPGRGKLLPRIQMMQHAFKTPTLRNVDRRSPYMHDGSVRDLEGALDLYDRGGDVRRPSLSAESRPLRLSAEDTVDLLAFLRTLTSDDPQVVLPQLPR